MGCGATKDASSGMGGKRMSRRLSFMPIKRDVSKQTLTGHQGWVCCLTSISPSVLCSGSRDGTIRLWDWRKGSCLRTLVGHGGFVWCVVKLSETQIASCSSDGTVRVWDIGPDPSLPPVSSLAGAAAMTGSPQLNVPSALGDKGLNSSRSPPASARSMPPISARGHPNQPIVPDEASDKCIVLKGHTDCVQCLINLSETQLVSGSDDGKLMIWDVPKGIRLATLSGHKAWVRCVCKTGQNELASGSRDDTIKIWTIDANGAGVCRATLSGHNGCVVCLEMRRAGELVSGGMDGVIKVWDLKNAVCRQTLTGHAGCVWSLLTTTDDSGEMISGSSDAAVKVWDADGRCRRTLLGHAGWILTTARIPRTGVASIPSILDDSLVDPSPAPAATGTAARDGSAKMDPAADGPVVPKKKRKSQLVVSAGRDGAIKVWDPENGQCLKTMLGHSGCVRCLVSLGELGDFASGSEDGLVKIWSLPGPSAMPSASHPDLANDFGLKS